MCRRALTERCVLALGQGMRQVLGLRACKGAHTGPACADVVNRCGTPPPPPYPDAGFWFMGQKYGNTGSPCLDKPVLLPGTYHRTHVAGISQSASSEHGNTKQHASTHPRAQEHMELQLHQHFATHTDPSCSLHNTTNHIGLEPQK